MDFNVLILAAGEGTRMKSAIPKVLQPILGIPMLRYVLKTVESLKPVKSAIVLGNGKENVQKAVDLDGYTIVTQKERLGTGHAVLSADKELSSSPHPTVVLYGDNPFLQASTIKELVSAYYSGEFGASILTVRATDPAGYGRIIRDSNDNLSSIVEEKDADQKQRLINEVNAGSYCFNTRKLFEYLSDVKPHNKQKEIYLTDVIGIMVDSGHKIQPVMADNEMETMGIDSKNKLAAANALMRDKINSKFMEEGVTIQDPLSTWIQPDVEISRDTVILPNTLINGRTSIGEECIIGPNTLIEDARIGNRAKIQFAVVKESSIGSDTSLGPFCYLRNQAVINDSAKVGTFVEIKKSSIGKKSKVPHLSYMGDAEVGEDVNIGAGSITCNYNGKTKHKTKIGDNAFIGSDTLFVAPVNVGEGAVTGAGSVVKKDVDVKEVVAGMPARKIRKREDE